MKYSVGCAFNLDQIIINLKLKSLKYTCEECKKLTKTRHRDKLAKRIFYKSLIFIIEDIIYNNVTFNLPVNSNKKCQIRMEAVTGKEFKELRKKGKFRNVDITKSWFTGYRMGFFMYGKRTPRRKEVYLNPKYRELITAKTNEGMNYGDSNNDTYIAKYIDLVCNEFPSISKSDISKILNYCWKSIYLHNSYGGDVLLRNKEIWCYIGNLKKNSLAHFYYYIRKLAIKIRVLNKRKKIPWDGYYYFALTVNQYQKYLDQIKPVGRKKRIFNYGAVLLYKIFDDCKLCEHSNRYIFRIPYITEMGLKHFVWDLTTDKAELVLVREPLKFKDILVYEHKYDVL